MYEIGLAGGGRHRAPRASSTPRWSALRNAERRDGPPGRAVGHRRRVPRSLREPAHARACSTQARAAPGRARHVVGQVPAGVRGPGRRRRASSRAGMPRLGPRTITGRSMLERALADVRARRLRHQRRGVGAGRLVGGGPIFDGVGECVAAMSVAGPITRMPADQLDHFARHGRRRHRRASRAPIRARPPRALGPLDLGAGSTPGACEPMTMTPDATYSLADRYQAAGGEVLITGIQALVRGPLDQLRADRQAGLHTAGFVSGYQGSPLGGYDRELQANRSLLDELHVVHRPALNEELGATAVMGSQLASNFPARRYDGVRGRLVRQVARRRPGRRRHPSCPVRRHRPPRRGAGPRGRRPGVEVVDPAVAVRARPGRPRPAGAVPRHHAGRPRPLPSRHRAVARVRAVGGAEDRHACGRRDRSGDGRPRSHPPGGAGHRARRAALVAQAHGQHRAALCRGDGGRGARHAAWRWPAGTCRRTG